MFEWLILNSGIIAYCKGRTNSCQVIYRFNMVNMLPFLSADVFPQAGQRLLRIPCQDCRRQLLMAVRRSAAADRGHITLRAPSLEVNATNL